MKKLVIPAVIAALLTLLMITVSARLASGLELFGDTRETGRWI